MRKYTMKPAALYIISGSLFLLAAAATLLIVGYLVSFKILMYSLVGLFWGLAVLFGLILLPMYFRRTVIYVSPSEITVHSGLIFLTRKHMKLPAVQYVTKVSRPLSSLAGFNFIAVHALGGTMILPFLNSVDCDEILSALRLEISRRS